MAVAAFIAGVKTPKFIFSLANEGSKDMVALMLWAQKYMKAEDTLKAREDQEEVGQSTDKKRPAKEKKEVKAAKAPKLVEQKPKVANSRSQPTRYSQYFTP